MKSKICNFNFLKLFENVVLPTTCPVWLVLIMVRRVLSSNNMVLMIMYKTQSD